jgi:hypothetical protein
MHTAVARKSNGAPQISQSEDWIICVWRRVVSQAGVMVFTRAYLRNATINWSYERSLLHCVKKKFRVA